MKDVAKPPKVLPSAFATVEANAAVNPIVHVGPNPMVCAKPTAGEPDAKWTGASKAVKAADSVVYMEEESDAYIRNAPKDLKDLGIVLPMEAPVRAKRLDARETTGVRDIVPTINICDNAAYQVVLKSPSAMAFASIIHFICDFNRIDPSREMATK